MVRRLQTKGAELDPAQLRRGLAAHRDEVRQWMAGAPRVEAMEVDYPDLVKRPETVIPPLLGFLGPDRLSTAERMAAVIDPSLHRRRQDGEFGSASGAAVA